jgi:hypothetical protein
MKPVQISTRWSLTTGGQFFAFSEMLIVFFWLDFQSVGFDL